MARKTRKKIRVTRKAYTRKDGTRVKATSYYTKDRGAKGRGPKTLPKPKRGSLGGSGYLEATQLGRRQRLGRSVSQRSYRATMSSLTLLENLGKRTLTKAQKAKIRSDKAWLKKKYG